MVNIGFLQLSSTTLIAGASIGSAVFGALLGSFGTYLVKRRTQAKAEQQQADRLRHALRSELISMQPMLRDLDYQTDPHELDTDHPEYFLSNDVYRGSIQEIGLLTESETIAVVEFYSQAGKVQAVGNNSPENIFIEVGERRLYERFLGAIGEIEENLEDIEPAHEAFDPPIPVIEDPDPI